MEPQRRTRIDRKYYSKTYLFFVFSFLSQSQGRQQEIKSYGLVPPAKLPVFNYLNPNFRHASVSFVESATNTWNVSARIYWKSRYGQNFVGFPKNQGSCGACWAFSAVSSLESAYALTFKTPKPSISTQQLIDCEGNGAVSNCAGGLPVEAFEYVSTLTKQGKGGLLNSSAYPYSDLVSSGQRCLAKSKGKYGMTMYELTDFFGWFGYLLALQSQPIVVLLQADHPTFQNFKGPSVYDNPNCYSNIVNHAVLLIGYNLQNNPPYWVIQNSWGPNWGDNGIMRIAMRGGEGVCGIQSNPGMYPVVSGNLPCAGLINPCGGGKCTPNYAKNTYKCTCPRGFLPVLNIDGSETCGPVESCKYFTFNPCNFGTCVDDMAGGYSCICPIGFSEGLRLDGRTTCVPDKSRKHTYIVKKGVSCSMVLSQFGITEAKLQSLNKGKGCKNVQRGLTLNISSENSCSLYYSSKKAYYCAFVRNLFGLSRTEFSKLNPSVKCKNPVPPFVQVCVKGGIRTDIPTGIKTYSVKPGDTCQSIIDSFKISASDFYTLNPGVFCDGLIPNTGYATPGQQVFVSGIVSSVVCRYRSYYVQRWDTCPRIIYLYFKKSITLFKKYNGNVACTISWLYVGRKICRPP